MFHGDVDIPLTVTAVRPETAGYRSLIFGRPAGFGYDAGDWIDIRFPGMELPGGTVYSIATAPTEPDLMISFRDGVTPFKRALMAAEPGDRVHVRQYGSIYGFRLRADRASTLIAGGVGIAPFRSMLKELADLGGHSDVQLVFLNKTGDFLFRHELDGWQAALPDLAVGYIVTETLKRKDRAKRLRDLIRERGQEFYIAGPSGMVTSSVQFLSGLGVSRGRIRTDDFGSY